MCGHRTATILKIITTVLPPGPSKSRTGSGRSQAIRFFPYAPANRMLNVIVSLQTPFRACFFWGEDGITGLAQVFVGFNVNMVYLLIVHDTIS